MRNLNQTVKLRAQDARLLAQIQVTLFRALHDAVSYSPGVGKLPVRSIDRAVLRDWLPGLFLVTFSGAQPITPDPTRNRAHRKFSCTQWDLPPGVDAFVLTQRANMRHACFREAMVAGSKAFFQFGRTPEPEGRMQQIFLKLRFYV